MKLNWNFQRGGDQIPFVGDGYFLELHCNPFPSIN